MRKQIKVRLEDRDEQVSVAARTHYLVACRETGSVLSEHTCLRTAIVARNRKQAHWFHDYQGTIVQMPLYVYQKFLGESYFYPVDNDGEYIGTQKYPGERRFLTDAEVRRELGFPPRKLTPDYAKSPHAK